MSNTSRTGRVVRRKAADIPAATEADLDRLEAAMNGPIDTTDIPERSGPLRPISRDARGHRGGTIQAAILDQLGRLHMTRYRLWKEARKFCPTLSESAVYEYLRGQRDIQVSNVEALLEAAGLRLTVGPDEQEGEAIPPWEK